MKRFQAGFVVLLVALTGVIARAQSKLTLGQNGGSEIQAILQKAVQQGIVPGVVAVVASKDTILYQSAFGMMDVAKQKPMTKEAIFRIASMTKPVCDHDASIAFLRRRVHEVVSGRRSRHRTQPALTPVANNPSSRGGNYRLDSPTFT